MHRLFFAAVLLALFLPALAAAEEDAREKKRRVIFVPHDQLEALLAKHGRGVMMGVGEYLDLWRLAKERGAPDVTEPAADTVILGGSLTGTVDDEKADFTVTYRIRVLRDGVRRVSFPIAGFGVVEAFADGKPALLSRDAKGGYLLLGGKGDHVVSIRGTARVTLKEEVRRLSVRLALATSLSVDLTIPAGMELPEGHPGTWMSQETEEEVRLTGHLPPGQDFSLTFLPRKEEGAKSPLLHARGRALHRVGPRLMRTVSVTEVTIHRKPVTEIVLTVPAGSLVTNAAAPGLTDWDLTEDAETVRVRLVFEKPVAGTVPVALESERNLPGPGVTVLPAIHVPAAADERGLVAVAFETGLSGRILSAEGLSRVPVPTPPKQKGRRNKPLAPSADGLVLSGASAAYRYWSAERTLTASTETPEGGVDCVAVSSLALLEDVRELSVVLRYKPRRERIFALSPVLPRDYELRDVKIATKAPHTWERTPDGTLAVRFPSGVAPESTVRITARLSRVTEAWRADGWQRQILSIPVADPNLAKGEVQGLVTILADPGFDVRDLDLAGLTPEPVERVGIAGARLAYRWRGRAGTGRVEVIRLEPKVSVRHVAFVAPGEKIARYSGFLHYTVQRAGVREFRFLVSGGHGDRLHVRAPGSVEPVRTAQEDGTDLWTVTLPEKVRGDVFLALDLEQEMTVAGDGREFVFPEVTVPGVEDETGYLAVESGDNMEVVVESRGLHEIGLEEMGPLAARTGYRPTRGFLAAFQYAAHPVGLTLTATRFEEAGVLTAFVESARLLTVIGDDGTMRTRATYRLLNADRQFLRVRLPVGAQLWGALVAGKAVKPSLGADGEALVPLVTTAGESAIEVVLLYEARREPLGSTGELDLEAPVLPGVLGAEAEWEVWLPSGYEPTGAEGVFGARFGPPPDPWIYRAFTDLTDALRVDTSARDSAGARRRGGDTAAAVEVRPRTRSAGLLRPAGGEVDGEGPLFEDPTAWEAKVEDHGRMDEKIARPEAEPPPPMPSPQDPGATPDSAPSGGGREGGEDQNEADNDMAFEEDLGEKDFLGDAPFDGPATNASIGVGGGAGGKFAGRGGSRLLAPPRRLGKLGGLSLDVPLVPGGRRQVVRALGVRGGVRIHYVETDERESLGYALSVLTALVGLLVTGVLRKGGGVESRRLPPVVFVVLVGSFATFAPAWFGARDLTLWDAVARGTIWAALLMIGLRFARWAAGLFTPRRAATAAFMLLALFATQTKAQAEPPAKKPDLGETVYVPFDPERLGDLEDAGKVFLPFERFRELWNAAHPERRIEAPDTAPVPWLLTAAGYEASVEGETVRIEARFDLVVLAEGWVEVSLPLSPAVVEEASVDGEAVRVLSRSGAHVLVLRGKGGHRVELTLRALLARKGDSHILAMALPPVPHTRLRLALPFPDAEVTVDGPAAPRIEDEMVEVHLGPTGKLALGFKRKTSRPEIESRIEIDSREVLTAREGRVEARLETVWRVVSGEVRAVEFALDPEWELVAVTGSDVKAWMVDGERLSVVLGRTVKDETVIVVTVERADGVRARSVAVPRLAPLGAVRERGVLAVAASPDLRVTLDDKRNLDRIAANAKEFGPLMTTGTALHSAWRFVLRPLGLTLQTEPVRAEVRVEIPVMYVISRELLRGRVSFFFDVRGDGTFEFPVRLPADLEIDSVEGAGLDRWWRDGDVLTFSTASPVRGRFRPTVRFRKRLDPEAVRVEIPEIHAVGAANEWGYICVARTPELSLTVLDDADARKKLKKEDVRIFRSWQPILPSQVATFGYRQDGEAYALAFARSFPEARVRPVTTTHLQVEDHQVVVDAHFFFVIENAGEDTFRVFLPEGEGEDPIVVAERQKLLTIEPFEEEGRVGRMLTLVLQQPAVGAYAFHLVYERKLDLRDGDLQRGSVTVRGLVPEGENAAAYLFAVNISRGEAAFGRSEGLEVADPEDFPIMPEAFRVGGPDHDLIQRAWRSRKGDWSLPVNLVIRSFADFPDLLVTSAELVTAVGRDGWTRNKMTYRVLNRTRQFLEISLPDGSIFEAVRVGGRGVKPGRRITGGEERILVPLTRMQAGDISTEVEIFWSRSLGDGDDLADVGDLRFHEPVIHGLSVERTFFTVHLPEDYSYSFDGNMEEVREAAQRLYRAKRKVAELKQVVEVQTAGGKVQQSRADDNFLRGAGEVALDLELDDKALNAMERADLAKLKKEVVRLRVQAGRNFASRGGRRQPAPDRALSREEVNALLVANKALAEKQTEQQYRHQGKGNVAAQGWMANQNQTDNDLPFDGPSANAAIGQWITGRQQPGGRLESQTGATRLGAEWRAALDEIRKGALPQVTGAYDVYNFRSVQGRAGQTSTPQPRSGETRSAEVGLALDRSPLEISTRAGLLSLPVTVPERGRVYRFQKLNGGAELTVSVGTPKTGRSLTGFGLFAAVIAVLAAFYRFRPHHKIPYFWPGTLFLLGIVAGAGTGAALLTVFALIAAAIWTTTEYLDRRA